MGADIQYRHPRLEEPLDEPPFAVLKVPGEDGVIDLVISGQPPATIRQPDEQRNRRQNPAPGALDSIADAMNFVGPGRFEESTNSKRIAHLSSIVSKRHFAAIPVPPTRGELF